MVARLDRQAMALCQAVHTAVRGNPNRWVALYDVTELEGGELDRVALRA